MMVRKDYKKMYAKTSISNGIDVFLLCLVILKVYLV